MWGDTENFKTATKVVVDRQGRVVQAVDAVPVDVGADYLHGVESIGALSLDNTTHVFTIASVAYWHKGRRFASDVPITVDVDEHLSLAAGTRVYLYFSAPDGVLYASTSAWSIFDDVMVYAAFWNGSAFSVENEIHGYRRDLEWHYSRHMYIGAMISPTDFSLTAPSTGSPSTVSIAGGTIADEDVRTSHGTQTNCRVWYRTGANAWTWVDSNSIYPTNVRFVDSAAAYALTDVAANQYINVWLYAAPDVTPGNARGIYAVVETKATSGYTTIALARAAGPPNLSGSGLSPEVRLLYRVIMKGDETFAELTDYRGSSVVPAGGGAGSPSAGAVTTAPGSSPYDKSNVQAYLEALVSGKAESSHTHTIASSFGMTIDGGGAAITTGSKKFRTVNFAGTLTGWRIIADQSGSIVVDVKKATYSGFPTTASVAGTAKPTLSTAQKNENTNLAGSGWGTVAFSAGDVFEFVVDSASTVTWVVIDLQYSRSV